MACHQRTCQDLGGDIKPPSTYEIDTGEAGSGIYLYDVDTYIGRS